MRARFGTNTQNPSPKSSGCAPPIEYLIIERTRWDSTTSKRKNSSSHQVPMQCHLARALTPTDDAWMSSTHVNTIVIQKFSYTCELKSTNIRLGTPHWRQLWLRIPPTYLERDELSRTFVFLKSKSALMRARSSAFQNYWVHEPMFGASDNMDPVCTITWVSWEVLQEFTVPCHHRNLTMP